MYCRKCGHALEEGDAFCTNCGTPIPKEELVSRRLNAAASNPEFKWNVWEEFPEPRKRETVDFNWSDGTMTPREDRLIQEEIEAPYETPTSRGFVTLDPAETGAPEPAKEPSRPAEYAPETPARSAESVSSARVERPTEHTPETRVFTTPLDIPRTTFTAPRETIAVPRDTYAAPAETIAVPRETYAAPHDTYAAPAETIAVPRTEAPVEEPARSEPVTPRNTTESAIFRDIEQAEADATERRDNRFYTFTRKNEEFQKLLDREYERVRRNGTPVERPLSAESTLFGYDLVADRPEDIPVTTPADPPAPPAREAAPAPQTARPVSPAPQPAPAAPAAPRVEPTLQNNPDEIRTIWEEIKADMERENAERIAKAAEAERLAKMKAAGVVNRKDLLRPSEHTETRSAGSPETERTSSPNAGRTAPRTTGEVAAVTATALTKIWEDDEDADDEPKKKGRFWLVLFLIIVVIMLLILAGNVIQNFWPDTGAAAFAADAEEWLKNVWVDLKDFFGNLFK